MRVRVLNCVSNYFLYFAFLYFTLLCFRCGNPRKLLFPARKLPYKCVFVPEMPVSVRTAPAALLSFFVWCRFLMRIYIRVSVPVIAVSGSEMRVYIKSPPVLDKSPEVCYNNSTKFREIGIREKSRLYRPKFRPALFLFSVCLLPLL